MRLLVGHTHELDGDLLARVRRLLDVVFDNEFSDHDWENSLGGVHVIAFADDGETNEVIGHASVVPRRLIAGGRVARVGYVEGVGVRADQQRRGIGGEMMAVLEGVIDRSHDFGALSASDAADAMYESRGWQRWRGPLSAMTPDGIVATPEEEGGVFVWRRDGVSGRPPLDLSESLICDWRAGDVW